MNKQELVNALMLIKQSCIGAVVIADDALRNPLDDDFTKKQKQSLEIAARKALIKVIEDKVYVFAWSGQCLDKALTEGVDELTEAYGGVIPMNAVPELDLPNDMKHMGDCIHVMIEPFFIDADGELVGADKRHRKVMAVGFIKCGEFDAVFVNDKNEIKDRSTVECYAHCIFFGEGDTNWANAGPLNTKLVVSLYPRHRSSNKFFWAEW